MDPLTVTKQARTENVPLFLTFAELLCGGADLDASVCAEVKLAIEEACGNIIQHGYPDTEAGDITLSGRRSKDRLIITIEDWGHPFAPDLAPPPDLTSDWQERQVGGLGWHLIRQAIDDIRYRPRSNETEPNQLTLVKQLAATA